MQPGAAMDLRIDRARSAAAAPAHWSTPTTLGPPGSLCADEPRVCGPPAEAHAVTFQPAQVVQFSPGADT
jgi:hypothetical protein